MQRRRLSALIEPPRPFCALVAARPAPPWLAALALVLGMGSSSPARADGPEVYVGRWSFHESRYGVSADGGGPFKLRLFPEGGRYTCILHGSVTMQGNTKRAGMVVETSGTVTIGAPMCAGSYDPAAGSITGSVTVHSKSNLTMTLRNPKDDTEQSKRLDSARDEAATLKGQRSGSTFTGTIVDDEGVPMRFTATLQAGDEGEPGAPPPAPPAPEPGDKAAPPPDEGDEGAKADTPEGEPSPPSDEPPAGEPPGPEPGAGGGDLRDKLSKAKTPQERDAIVDKHLADKEAQARKEIETLEKELDDAAAKPGGGADTEIGDALEDPANKLGKDMKDAVEGQLEKAVLDKADKVFDKAWSKVSKAESNVKPSSVKSGYDKLQKAKETLEGAKKVYDRVKEIDEKVKNGEISAGRGKLLKVGAFMGKAVSTLVGWLPIPGINEAGSKVTEEAFEKSMKVGEKLGKNATTQDCCTQDPEADCCQ